nr:protein-L-isoaspartate(D-aspartate) O-methyltransferase [Halosegnis sp. DT85]
MVARLRERDDIGERALDALAAVPRHEFVPPARRDEAYADRPLPIGEGQTISAPHMVAAMADLLDPRPGDRVLEIGTGCGYHAAVTAELGADVFSVEYHAPLAERARERLDRLGYGVAVRAGDGREGWPEHAPYDACYLTCAAESVPDALFAQVRPGGTLLAPVGGATQRLVAFTVGEGACVRDRTDHGGVRFVPLL